MPRDRSCSNDSRAEKEDPDGTTPNNQDVDLDLDIPEDIEGWLPYNQGGQGDCGYRAVAEA